MRIAPGPRDEDSRPLEREAVDGDVAAQIFKLAAQTNVNVVLSCAIEGLIERGLSREQVLAMCLDAYDRLRTGKSEP